MFISSFRYAVRRLWASRAFTTTAVITLALGIGATTAILTLLDSVIFKPLPVHAPGRLYRVGDGDDTNAQGRHGRWGFFSFPLYERLKSATPEFEDITAFDWGGSLFSVRKQGAAEAARPLRAEYVTGSYFSTLGIDAFAGRVLTLEDDHRSALPVIMLSHHAWQAIYGSDPTIVGSALIVEGHPFNVIGITAPGFFGETVRGDPPDMWIPLQQEPMIAGTGSLLSQSISPWLAVIGRLRPGATIAGMEPRLSEMLRHWIRYDAGFPSNWMPDILRDLSRQTIAVVPAGAGIGLAGVSAKERYGPSLQILLVLCGLVLVVACANVANLLLVRSLGLRLQTAVRLAIGATRRQIVAEALGETVLLALAGGIAGLPLAVAAARLLLVLGFRNSQFVPITPMPSFRVLAFTLGLSLLTGILFGVVPAWFETRTDPIHTLRGRGSRAGRHSSRARAALLIVQATLCVVVIAGATMLSQSVANLQRQNLGYPVKGRIAVGLKRLPATYAPDQLSALYRDVERRLVSLPGVYGAGLALYNPLAGNWNQTIVVSGHSPNAIGESDASWNRVSTDYLQNLGVPLVRGRLFTAADNETAAPVAIVNEAFVKRFFKQDEDAIDQHFALQQLENASTFHIVGIVRDAKFASFNGLSRPARPMFFLPLAQRIEYQTDYMKTIERLSHFMGGIMLRTDYPFGDLERALRKTLAEADPNLTITDVRTMAEQVEVASTQQTALATVARLFAIVALVLAAGGVYAVTAYMVVQQTNEIGIRMALGAQTVDVLRLVLASAFRRVVVGLVGGLLLAMCAARFLANQLYGVLFWDPLALTVAAGSLATCALVAALLPGRRAAAISPMQALRTE